MRSLRSLCLLGLMVLTLCAPVWARARPLHDQTTEAPTPLTEGVATVPVGIGQGSFDRYALPSKGDGHTVTITITTTAHDEATTRQIGFDVYAPSGARSTSSPAHEMYHPFDTSKLTIQLTEKGTYLLQVFNYGAGEIFNYSLVAVDPAAPLPPTPTPGSAEQATDLHGATSGYIHPGVPEFYKVTSATSSRPLTLDIQINPANPATADAIGFAVYAPSGIKLGRSTITNTPGAPFDHQRFVITDPKAGAYTIEVFNFTPAQSASFLLTVVPEDTGAPTPTAAPPGSIGPDSKGSLAPGEFAHYVVPSTGTGRTVVITIKTTAHDEATTRQIGFDVYAPRDGKDFPSTPDHASGHPFDTSSLTLQLTDAGDYLLQVYNYGGATGGEVLGYELSIS